jgi:hypothetical protein
MNDDITITRLLANDIIFAFSKMSNRYDGEMRRYFMHWKLPFPVNDEQLKNAIYILDNDRIETLLLKIEP